MNVDTLLGFSFPDTPSLTPTNWTTLPSRRNLAVTPSLTSRPHAAVTSSNAPAAAWSTHSPTSRHGMTYSVTPRMSSRPHADVTSSNAPAVSWSTHTPTSRHGMTYSVTPSLSSRLPSALRQANNSTIRASNRYDLPKIIQFDDKLTTRDLQDYNIIDHDYNDDYNDHNVGYNNPCRADCRDLEYSTDRIFNTNPFLQSDQHLRTTRDQQHRLVDQYRRPTTSTYVNHNITTDQQLPTADEQTTTTNINPSTFYNTSNSRSFNELPDRHHSTDIEQQNTSTIINHRKKQLKLQHYDGSTSFDSFLAQFRNAATYNEWNDADQLAHMKASLQGNAANVLWDTSSEKTDSIQKLCDILHIRFGTIGMAERYRTDLRTRRRRCGETLQELHLDIQRLTSLAFPGPRNDASDIIGRDAFIDSLNDDNLSLKVREREPLSLNEAAKIAIRLESYQPSRQPTISPIRSPTIQIQADTGAGTNISTHQITSLLKENTQLKMRLDKLESRMNKNNCDNSIRHDIQSNFRHDAQSNFRHDAQSNFRHDNKPIQPVDHHTATEQNDSNTSTRPESRRRSASRAAGPRGGRRPVPGRCRTTPGPSTA